MYLPADTSRYARQTPLQFNQMINGSIFPVQVTDPNCIFHLDESEFQFDLLDSTFKPDITLRISRTPLLTTDPQTYAMMSRFVEYNLRRYHSTLGNSNQNQLSKPLKHPPEFVGPHFDNKTEVLPMGCMVNPLIADPFKPVHLTPGCLTAIVDYTIVDQWQRRREADRSTSVPGNSIHRNSSVSTGLGEKLFANFKSSRPTGRKFMDHTLKPPRTNLARSGSSFLERVSSVDGFSKKLANATKLLIGCHGRAINMVILDDNPKKIAVDPPALKVILGYSCMSCIDTFPYTTSNGEKNLDVLIGFTSGDLLWLNPIRQRYTRWNKNGRLKSCPVVSVEWSKCGSFAIAGFADGDMMIFDRDLEDDGNYGHKEKVPVSKARYMRTYRSLRLSKNASADLSGESETKESRHNPIAHYKFSKKAIVDITTHPYYHNIVAMACDDGYLRIFDLLKEQLTDIQESYYSGFLSVSFSDDGKYLFAGGEDDLASIYEFQGVNLFSPATSGLIKQVARMEGSKSWIRDISIDSHGSQSGILYRVGCVGDGGAIHFFEFQPRQIPVIKKALKKPRALAISSPPVRNIRGNLSSALAAKRSPGGGKTGRTSQALQNRDSSQLPLKGSSFRKVLSGKHSNNRNSVSSMASTNTKYRSSIINIMSHGSNTSLQQLRFQQQQQQETSFDDKYVKDNTIFADYQLPCLKTNTGASEPEYHKTLKMNECPKIFPICEKDVDLGRMYSLYFEKDFVWAFLATGDLIRWRRP